MKFGKTGLGIGLGLVLGIELGPALAQSNLAISGMTDIGTLQATDILPAVRPGNPRNFKASMTEVLAYTWTSSGTLTSSALLVGAGVGVPPTVLGSLGTTATVLHGNAAGLPTWGAVSLTADVSGVLPSASGGTGVNNGSSTITLGGNLVTSGAFATTLVSTNTTSVTLPTSGTLVNSAVATLSSLTSIGTIGTGVWQGTVVAGLYGGTGVANSGKTLTLGASTTLASAAQAGNCAAWTGTNTLGDSTFYCGASYGLLAKVTGVNMNITTDQNIALNLGSATKYALGPTASAATTYVAILTGCSAAASTAAGGIYTGAGKTGITLTTTTAFATLAGASNDLQRVVATGAALTKSYSTNPLFFALTTPQGSAVTCDLYVYGTPLP